ncbi:hypothetical protein OH77DRAFT_1502723 [Trametes cingulata]|nr:hypothetical protein OH77DRAFT_1502723 [Trametes cingulata]
MRTRPGLKSCLKITPPITPDLSAASSPCGSGRTSPSLGSDGGSSTGSGGRKTVSFCSEPELEEVFFVDEWDRTPAAVTPKLSYQDILELKQLRISLPYSPPPPTSRQPFTTSAPSSSGAGPSNKPPFPVSRFATGPSHTPSKWKNRSQPQQAEVDPEILPYLDAVPIRLLPLLPQSPSEPEPTPAPEPHPQTPTPTASPERRPAPPPPSEPPEIRIEPPAPAPISPPSPTQLRKPNFAFLPLLPVQDPPPVLPPPVPSTNGPTRPKRTFNMTFLPVNAIPETEPLTSAPGSSEARTDDPAVVGTSASAPLPSSSSSLAPPSPSELSSAPTPTPSIPQDSTGLESDNDTETDTTDTYASDTDAESDAPSTSTLGSSLNSPPLEDDMEVEARLEQIKLGTADLDSEQPAYVSRISAQDPGSYFPPVLYTDTADDAPPALPSGPGQTPPLSVLYPSPTSQHQPLLPLDAISATAANASIPSAHPQPPHAAAAGVEVEVDLPPIAARPSLLTGLNSKKLTLEALPSPALMPPSPFELEPLSVMDSSPAPANNPRLDLAADTSAQVVEKLAALSVTDAAQTPDDSPMLTLESMRAAWDASARVGLGVGVDVGAGGVAAGSALAPSLSRRRSS